MSKKLFVILGVLLLVALGYSVSLAAHPWDRSANTYARRGIVNEHPDQEPLLRPDVKLQEHPWDDLSLLRPDVKMQGHPWGEKSLRPIPKGQQGHPWGDYSVSGI